MMCSRCKTRMAVVFMTKIENGQTVSEGICLKCAKAMGIKPVNDLVQKMGMSDEDIDQMSQQLMETMEELDEDFQSGGAQSMPFLQGFLGNTREAGPDSEPPEEPPSRRPEGRGGARTRTREEPKRKFLDGYCDNLTLKAREGRLDNIIGREKEIYRVLQILNRRTKNNPCLIGEPGVGKTAIAEGIALKLAKGDVPPKLMDKEIYLLDLTALVAGTQFRGQFESRVKGLIDEVKALGNIILFIDEVHNLVGAGDADGSMNAANILKPALSRGEIQVIGATTFNEYRKHIEKDSALERRFQPVKVEEPSMADALEMLKGIKHYYEQYHRVQVNDQILGLAVQLSERYITDRYLPDKAIDLLDEACSCATLRNAHLAAYDRLQNELKRMQHQEIDMEQSSDLVDYEQLARLRAAIMRLQAEIKEIEPKALGMKVTVDDVTRVIELWTGIPASKIKETELRRVAKLEEVLKERVIGQDEAISLVAAAVRRTRVQLSAQRRPASFIFVGPTGVGKTELAKVLSRELFDSVDPLIRLDMSEFMEKHSVSRIIGSPPGYIGYDEAGQLTEKVRRKPYAVILLDEIEKAHPDVMNILLQILDEGRITDAQGRTVSFENTLIIMTSNAGSNIKSGALGFNKAIGELGRDKVEKALSEFLRPEFLGRVDEVVVFRQLDENDYRKIAALMLEELRAPLKERGIELSFSDEALAYIARRAYGNHSGARDLRRIIRKEVEDKVSLILVERVDNLPSAISIGAENEALIVAAI